MIYGYVMVLFYGVILSNVLAFLSVLSIKFEVILSLFFAACNCVLGTSHSLDQILQLLRQRSVCLPLLNYGLCAVKLTVSQCAELNRCWNTVFRRIFNFLKFDSVRSCICDLGGLDFHHIRINLLLKLVKIVCYVQMLLNQLHFTLLFTFTSFRTISYFSSSSHYFLWSMIACWLAY
jgi:hypothetical protein